MYPAVTAAPGAAHRLHLRRGARRTEPHGRLSAVVLRLRAAGARAAHRACRARGRPGAPVYGPGDGGRARLHPRVRAPVERRADALARDALREHRPDRGIEGQVARGPRSAHRCGNCESFEVAAARRGEPRPAAAAARAGPLQRRAGGTRIRRRVAAAGRQRATRGGGARGPVRAAARPLAPRNRIPDADCRRASPSVRCSPA